MGIVSEKFQVVIPPAVRKAAGIKAGQRVKVTAAGGVVQITPEKPGKPVTMESGIGIVKADRHVTIEQMDGAYGRDEEE